MSNLINKISRYLTEGFVGGNYRNAQGESIADDFYLSRDEMKKFQKVVRGLCHNKKIESQYDPATGIDNGVYMYYVGDRVKEFTLIVDMALATIGLAVDGLPLSKLAINTNHDNKKLFRLSAKNEEGKLLPTKGYRLVVAVELPHLTLTGPGTRSIEADKISNQSYKKFNTFNSKYRDYRTSGNLAYNDTENYLLMGVDFIKVNE